MLNKAAEKTTALLILIGAPLTTLFLLTETVTDPVNTPKLFIAGGFCFALILTVLFFNSGYLVRNFKIYLIFSLIFLAAAVNSVIASELPFSQNLYGVYGRNTGLIAYVVLALIGVGTLGLGSKDGFKKILFALQFAGLVNIAYCGWVIVFGDFLSWNNQYGNILGLFGNPDFISAFLGIYIVVQLVSILNKEATWKLRIFLSVTSLIALIEIIDSHAIQGLVVTLGGSVVVVFFVLKAYFKSRLILVLYTAMATTLGYLAIMGALQKGPLTFIYKTSVSLRGSYWNAAWTMGSTHPFTGVGMDGYGDWYRRARSIEAATNTPGPNVLTNAAHNVVLDFFAFGGWPLLLSYLTLLILAGIASFKVIKRTKSYDPVFIAMFAAWLCYQVQSLISINQIGLAIWGWILTGGLISYEYSSRIEKQAIETRVKNETKLKKSAEIISPQLIAGIGVIVGLLVAVPPLSADMKWKSALASRDANQIMEALKPGYLSPENTAKYQQAMLLFANSNLMDQAHLVAISATNFNSDDFDSWRILYFLTNSTEAEKSEAVKNMKRLDPRNPDVTAP